MDEYQSIFDDTVSGAMDTPSPGNIDTPQSPDGIDCPICWDRVTDRSRIVSLDCHEFCRDCLDTWDQYRQDLRCPICRQENLQGLMVPVVQPSVTVEIPDPLGEDDRRNIMQPRATQNELLNEYAEAFLKLRPWASILAFTSAWFERRLELSELYDLNSVDDMMTYLVYTNDYFIHWLNTPGKTISGIDRQICTLLRNFLGRQVRPRELIVFLKAWALCWRSYDMREDVNEWLQLVNSVQAPFDLTDRFIPRYFQSRQPNPTAMKIALIHLAHRSESPDLTAVDLGSSIHSVLDWLQWPL